MLFPHLKPKWKPQRHHNLINRWKSEQTTWLQMSDGKPSERRLYCNSTWLTEWAKFIANPSKNHRRPPRGGTGLKARGSLMLVRIHPLGNMNVSTLLQGNPTNCGGLWRRTCLHIICVNRLKICICEYLPNTYKVWAAFENPVFRRLLWISVLCFGFWQISCCSVQKSTCVPRPFFPESVWLPDIIPAFHFFLSFFFCICICGRCFYIYRLHVYTQIVHLFTQTIFGQNPSP